MRFLPLPENRREQMQFLFFRNERSFTRLIHQNIAETIAFEETEDELVIVTEYVDGTGLSQLIEDRSLDEELIINIAIQMAHGLLVAHHKGMYHHDFKSSSIMMKQDGRVKILGFAKAWFIRLSDPDRFNAKPDTFEYFSPERLRGLNIDERSDLWSFGIILYEMATGYRPFRGDNIIEVLKAIMKRDHQPISSRITGISNRLTNIIDSCLEEDIVNRYQCAQDILEDLYHLQV
jgi:serine/threonine-protein kinase